VIRTLKFWLFAVAINVLVGFIAGLTYA